MHSLHKPTPLNRRQVDGPSASSQDDGSSVSAEDNDLPSWETFRFRKMAVLSFPLNGNTFRFAKMVVLPCFPPPHLAFKSNPSYIPGLWTCCPMTGGFIIFEGRVGATSARQRCAHAQAQNSTKLVLVPTGSAFFCCVLASYGVL